MKDQPLLFAPPAVTPWRAPDILPRLHSAGVRRITLDVESKGKDKHVNDAVGLAARTDDGRKFYLPWGHLGGGNLQENIVKRWAKNELVDLDVVNLNIGFDLEKLRLWGVDLEQQNCRPHEVAFPPALLNEHRYGGLNLNDLGVEYCGRKKYETDIDPERLWEHPAANVGPYAEDDADLAWAIDQATQPLIEAENLQECLKLEDDLIWCVNHMERSGARLDVPKLRRWDRELQERAADAEIRLADLAGFHCNPDSTPDMRKLFGVIHLDPPKKETYDTKGNLQGCVETFEREYLELVDHPAVRAAMRCRHYRSLRSKYTEKYLRHLRGGEILRYSLHQLRAGEEGYGTISGRFSSSNVNIQQVFKVDRQIELWGDEYIIRELFIPDDGYNYFGADANQIEFRLFAHYSNSKDLIRRYLENPLIDFHALVAAMINQPRHTAKNNNFGKLYGMGVVKLCIRLFKIVNEENLKKTREIIAQYDAEFPEARRLLLSVAEVAEQRNYVKTVSGRRGRFTEHDQRYHSALNKVLQGSAADVNKKKLKQLYDNRATCGIHKMRLTVHDEVDGDVDKDPKCQGLIKECLDEQAYQFRVPLIWDVEVGANWREVA